MFLFFDRIFWCRTSATTFWFETIGLALLEEWVVTCVELEWVELWLSLYYVYRFHFSTDDVKSCFITEVITNQNQLQYSSKFTWIVKEKVKYTGILVFLFPKDHT